MRAGQLKHWVILEKPSEIVDECGVPQVAWTTFAEVKAKFVQQSSEEFVRNYGVAAENRVIFKIRYLPGVTTAHRIIFGDLRFDIVEVKALGRVKDLELRCVERTGL